MIIAKDPHAYLGQVVDNGHCMRHVQVAHGVPHSSKLRAGPRVRDADVPRGTIIATFGGTGRYENRTDGSSHIAVLLEKRQDGLLVVDQWRGQRVHERLIRYRDGEGRAVNDGDQFHVVEVA